MGRRRSSRKKDTARAEKAGWSRPLALVVFFAAVFAVKLVVLGQLQHHPLLQPDAGLDSASYVDLARRVLAGDLALGPGLYYLSPLYVYFLAVTLAMSDSFTWVRLVQIALGTATVGCVFVTARDWFGRRAAWAAAGLAALTGVFTFYEILILQAALDAFLTAAALMFLTKALLALPPEGGSHELPARVASAFRRKELLAGAFFGLQILNRPNVIVAVAGVTLSLLVIPAVRAGILAGRAHLLHRDHRVGARAIRGRPRRAGEYRRTVGGHPPRGRAGCRPSADGYRSVGALHGPRH